ncbi:MAG: ParB/RepB/Spo0J family partition protein, partial [Syntrophales bacterium]|nr:ParB/RepB/Spo0J family partition protein [Syntrophales bacterium]
MQQNIDQASTNLSQVSYERKEDFEIDKVVTSKYDMRKNRSQISIDNLAEDIRQRGQIEYVHIAIIENDYHLLAGYTRYFALKQLGRKTIRAILYRNLSEEQIQSIVTGTNDLRVDPTTWDRICNIANFYIKNPDISIRSIRKNINIENGDSGEI